MSRESFAVLRGMADDNVGVFYEVINQISSARFAFRAVALSRRIPPLFITLRFLRRAASLSPIGACGLLLGVGFRLAAKLSYLFRIPHPTSIKKPKLSSHRQNSNLRNKQRS